MNKAIIIGTIFFSFIFITQVSGLDILQGYMFDGEERKSVAVAFLTDFIDALLWDQIQNVTDPCPDGMAVQGLYANMTFICVDNWLNDTDTAGWDKNESDDFSGSWNNLTDIPAGFSDNVDNDTTYTNLSEFNDDIGVSADWDECSDASACNWITDGDTAGWDKNESDDFQADQNLNTTNSPSFNGTIIYNETKHCLDGVACSVYITYNGTNLIIQG